MSLEIVDRLRIYEQLTRAIQTFDAGGRIVSMQVATFYSPPEAPDIEVPDSMIQVETMDIAYPSQMVEAIRSALADKRRIIVAELAELGVTGLGT